MTMTMPIAAKNSQIAHWRAVSSTTTAHFEPASTNSSTTVASVTANQTRPFRYPSIIVDITGTATNQLTAGELMPSLRTHKYAKTPNKISAIALPDQAIERVKRIRPRFV